MNPNPLEPEIEPRAPDAGKLGSRERLTTFLNPYRHVAWSMIIATSLVVFLAVLPENIRAALLRGLQAQGPLAIMLFCFSLLALSLLWSKGQRLDAWAFLYFNVRGSRPLWLDWIMVGITQLGNGLAALVIALVLFFVRENRLAYELILSTLTLWLVVELVKSVAHRSRPFVRLTQTRIVGFRESGLSFPSGHTSQAFFLVTLLVQQYHISLGAVIILYTVAVAVGITRMYVGAHYPRDVLAGAILGSVWGILGGMVDASFLVSG
jgi:membrane-associated phospholipid phosphatase